MSFVVGVFMSMIAAGVGAVLIFGWNSLRERMGGYIVVLLLVVAAGVLVATQIANHPRRPRSLVDWIDTASPAMAAMHSYYPAEYQTMVAQIREPLAKDDFATANNLLHAEITTFIGRHMKEIDDDGAKGLFTMMADHMRSLRASPAQCVGAAEQAPDREELSKVNRRAQTTFATIVKQLATHPEQPAAPLPKPEADSYIRVALSQLPPAERELAGPLAISGGKPQTAPEMAAMCDFGIHLYERARDAAPGVRRRLLVTL